MPTYQSTNPLARTNPLRSISLPRPAAHVLGSTAQRHAEWAIAIVRRDIPLLEQRYAVYCRALGAANRMKGAMRRHWQAQAFRQINSARAQLRAARKALVVAETAMLAFAPLELVA